MEPWILSIIIAAVFSVIGWLLSNKDKKQGDEIAELRKQHVADVSELRAKHEKENDELFKLYHKVKDDLAEFKQKIAENHYPKHELDQRFSQLNETIHEGFNGLSIDIKELVREMNDHLREHRTGGQ